MKIGDWVRWTYQSVGYLGQVVAVIPEGDTPAQPLAFPRRVLRSRYEHLGQRFTAGTLGCGMSRKGESYLIAVPKKPLKTRPSRAKPKLLWPRVSWLKPATKPEWATDMT